MSDFAEEWYKDLLLHKTVELGIEFMEDTIGELVKAKSFDMVDELMDLGITYPNITVRINLAMLEITKKKKDKYKSRVTYYEFCEKKFAGHKGKDKLTESLLLLE